MTGERPDVNAKKKKKKRTCLLSPNMLHTISLE